MFLLHMSITRLAFFGSAHSLQRRSGTGRVFGSDGDAVGGLRPKLVEHGGYLRASGGRLHPRALIVNRFIVESVANDRSRSCYP